MQVYVYKIIFDSVKIIACY